MENIRAYGVRRIKEIIPRFVLESVLLKPDYSLGALRSYMTLEAAISTQIIDASILLDMMLIDGKTETISLDGLSPIYNPDGTMVVHVPLERTGGSEILEVYRLNYASMGNPNSGFISSNSNNSDVDNKLDAIARAAGTIPLTSTAECSVIAPNTILANTNGVVGMGMTIDVYLSISSSLNHIPTKAYELFGDMCVARAEQFIYHQAVIEINRGFIDRGKELGVYKEIIMEYRDSDKTYRDLLKRYRKSAKFMDSKATSKYLAMITPSIM